MCLYNRGIETKTTITNFIYFYQKKIIKATTLCTHAHENKRKRVLQQKVSTICQATDSAGAGTYARSDSQQQKKSNLKSNPSVDTPGHFFSSLSGNVGSVHTYNKEKKSLQQNGRISNSADTRANGINLAQLLGNVVAHLVRQIFLLLQVLGILLLDLVAVG